MMVFISLLKSDCDTLSAIVDKAQGFPRAGVHIGGGIHVDMPASFKGAGSSPGWAEKQADIIPDKLSVRGYAYPTDGLAQLNQSTLSGGEKTTLNTDVAAAQPLPLDWLPTAL